MSRTGNLLFPDNEDDGWVTSIMKALPEKKPEDGKPGPDDIDDPVAIEAEAAFAELEAETAARDAISAAGWSAEAIPAPVETPPEFKTAEEEWRAATGLDAIDAAIEEQAALDEAFTAIDDPVAVEAEAAFAETAAETAVRDAIETAGWSADALSPGAIAALDSVAGPDPAEDDPLGPILDRAATGPGPAPDAADRVFAAGWSAIGGKADETGGIEKLTTDELKALDAALAKEALDPGHFAIIDDPVGLAGDAVFAEIAADVTVRDAIREAGWAADVSPVTITEAVPPEVLDALSPLSVSEQIALDAANAGQTISRMDTPSADDPVALEADSVFSGIAAELAIADAVLAAKTPPAPDPAMLARGEPRPPRAGPGLWEVEDLVRAEAEIAFEDAAYDFAYNTVDSLVTGEAAALAAFDQAIASGADPEEALALAIAAAEEIDPGAFGLTRVAAAAEGPADVRVADIGLDDAGLAEDTEDEDDEEAAGEPRPEDQDTFARVGGNFDLVDAEDAFVGGPGTDTLIGDGFEFSLDLDLVAGAGSAFRGKERDDSPAAAGGEDGDILGGGGGDDILTGTADSDNIFGYAGDDVLVGGKGADTLTGGGGADQFVFEGGSGVDTLAHAASLGTDTITDYSAADGDTFGLSDADFGFGDAGTLTAGANYFESAAATLSAAPLDASGGAAGPAIVVLGDGSGTDGVDIYYTDDASAMTADNSYQIADVDGANTGDLDAGDFNLRT